MTQTRIIQSIVLPNNTAWTFQYDSADPTNPNSSASGNLLQVTFPTGGYIKYGWTSVYICQPTPSSDHSTTYTYAVSARTVNTNDGTGEHMTTYSFVNVFGPANTTTYGTSSTDPLGQKTVYTMTLLGGTCSFYETDRTTYDSASQLIQSVSTDYHADLDPVNPGPIVTASSNVVPIRVTTSWPNGQISKLETDYDSGVAMSGSLSAHTLLYGVPIAQREYDYGSGAPGSLIRTTTTNYLALSNSSYLNNNLLSIPSSVVVTDSSGTTKASTTYLYDQFGLTSSGVTTQHDSTSPDGTIRGNLTTLQRWLNLPSPTNLNTTTTYYDTGTPSVMTDPGGHTTTSLYSSTFLGAYPTTITNALTQSATRNYDFNTGLVISATDLNNLSTSFTYDAMWRLATVTHADGGTETITHQESAFPFTTTLTKQINPSQSKITTNVFNGFGRVTQTQLSDPQGTVFTDSTYDALGRVATVSNPYRTGTDITTTTGTTTYAYDALGRKTSETHPDGSVLTTAYCGSSTLVTDPTGRWRRSRVDGLGRLVEVDEPNAPGATVAATGCPGTGEPILVTTYGYDTLGNLTSVLQNGSHQRTFTDDSLSRLLTSNNPEVGTITYAYNPDGTILSKKDARNITTTYTYDALHREKTVTYSNGDSSTSINYDESNCLGLSACQNIGQRTSMTDAAGSESWAYQVDATNHRNVHVDQRVNASYVYNGSTYVGTNITKTATYYLDFAGNVTQAVYPTGRTVNYTYDSANRPGSAADGSSGITYAAGFDVSPGSTCSADATCYTPQGTFYALSIGETATFTGLNLTHIYNSRLQPQEFRASSTGGNAIDVTYNFVDPVSTHNAGHVYGITNNLDTTRSQTFTYDQLNRISGAQTTSTHATSPSHCWGEAYSLDPWGNLNSIAAATNSAYTGCTQESGFSSTADGNNHLPAFSYDASGNTQSDGTNFYTWDAESQIKTAAGVTYAYDGDGRRVSKSNGKLYWYGSGSEILAETDASGNTTAEYIFFGGKRIAMLPASGSPIYYVEDLLGTSRVITTNTGIVCYDVDFYPYGGERPYTNTCPQNYKFEGKERDTETGNDDFGARYYSNRFGRWLSADWSAVPVPVPYANLTNPQTLNLYSMVADDPESFADLDGHTQQNAANSCGGYENNGNCQTQDQQQAATNAAAQSGGFLQKLGNLLSNNGWKTNAQVAADDAKARADWEKKNPLLPYPEKEIGMVAAPFGGVGGAVARAGELAGAMGKTKDFVTIAVTETEEGVKVVSSSENALRPAVQNMLQKGEVAAQGAGHAEVTGVNAAKAMGLTPTGVAASRAICPACGKFLSDLGIAALSALKNTVP